MRGSLQVYGCSDTWVWTTRHDYHGRPTSNFLVTFPENLEGFLEAVQLWILLDGGAKKSDLCLKGYLVHSEIPRGSRKKHRFTPLLGLLSPLPSSLECCHPSHCGS